jgi:hypothetical protein
LLPAACGWAFQIQQLSWIIVNRRDADMTNRLGHRPLTALALIGSSILGATVTVSAIARADDSVFNDWRFQSPSGDIVCVMLRNHDIYDNRADYGKGTATCQVEYPTYAAPPRQYVGLDGRPSTCWLSGWGYRFSLPEGWPAHLDCVGDDLTDPPRPLPTLEYGQARSVGAITCASEPSAMTCTDSTSGRFFRASRDSYQLG